MVEMRRPTTKPKMKMKSVAEIHGATNAWMGTRISRDHSRRMIVQSPIQLTNVLTGAERVGEGNRDAVEGAAFMPPRDRIRRRLRADTPLRVRPVRAPVPPSVRPAHC